MHASAHRVSVRGASGARLAVVHGRAPQPRIRASAASSSSTGTSQQEEARTLILQLVSQGYGLFNESPLMKGAVETLLSGPSPIPSPGAAIAAGEGTGTWQVFYAPHMVTMSNVLGTKWEPVIYKFGEDGSLVSHVQYKNAVGTGWLSASGRMFRKDEGSVEISFDKFWLDLGNTLRQDLPDETATVPLLGLDVPLDRLLGSVGRATFFPPLAVFPVLYWDEDVAVFKFPPLDATIAITKAPPTALPAPADDAASATLN